MGTQNQSGSSHFAKGSKSTFQHVAESKCRLHPLFKNMKLKITMYLFLMVVPTVTVRLPALLLTYYLRENKFGKNDYRHWCKEIFVFLTTDMLKSVDLCFTWYLYSCTSVQGAKDKKKKKGWRKFHVSCPRPKLQVYLRFCALDPFSTSAVCLSA